MLGFRNSLSTKWLLAQAAGLVLIFILGGYFHYRTIRTQIYSEIEHTGKSIVQSFEEVLVEHPGIFNTEGLQPIVHRFVAKIPNVERVTVMDYSARIIADSDIERVGQSMSQTAVAGVLKELRGTTFNFQQGGRQYLQVIDPIEGRYDPVRKSNVAGIVLVTLHLSHAEQTVWKAFTQTLWVFIGCFTFFWTLQYILIGHVFARPLGRLTQTAARLGEGDLSARTVVTSHDEIGELAGAFNHMAEELEKKAALEAEIVERRKAMEALDVARTAADAANRAKSEFLAHMSHEIRTPMNAIIGMAELLSETPLTTEQTDYVRIFRRAGENLLNIINDILDLSKVEAGLLELEQDAFDLNDAMERTAEFLSARAHEKSLDLNCYIEPGVPPFLIGDAQRLRQILINLLGNAIKFTERGEILLRVANDPAIAAPGALLFSVSDTGIGIAPDELEIVFESFKQADSAITRKFEGTGLGLTISRRLVKLMGGRIWVESQVGHGSTFYFTARFGLQVEPKPRPTVPVHLRGVRTLVIDDNATNRLILEQMLTAWGVSVTTAEGGPQGLAELKRSVDSGRPYQLLLLDCRMPKMDGFQVVEAINRKPGILNVTILMLTSDNRAREIARCRELGVRGYLVKPIKRNDLLQAVTNALGQSRFPSSKAQPSAETAPLATEHPRHILLAEDNEDNRTLILTYLKKTPHQVDIAENGLIALEKFKNGGPYDLVLMDMQMPLMDGYTATWEIRKWEEQQKATATPIIALTAYALKEEGQKCIDAGCNAHVTKPIKKATLMETIEKYAGRIVVARNLPAQGK